MSEPTYDAAYFIKKFTAIPAERWTVCTMKDEKTGACCALGHCGERAVKDVDPRKCKRISTAESEALWKLFQANGQNIVLVNDTRGEFSYPQDTPKERVLAALYEFQAKAEAESKPKKKAKVAK